MMLSSYSSLVMIEPTGSSQITLDTDSSKKVVPSLATTPVPIKPKDIRPHHPEAHLHLPWPSQATTSQKAILQQEPRPGQALSSKNVLGDVHPMLLHLLEEIHHHQSGADALQQLNVFTLSGGEDHFCLKLGGP
jgi:hypothetical protein